MNGTDGWIYSTDILFIHLYGWMNVWMYHMHLWMDQWMDVGGYASMDGSVDGCGWMDGCVGRYSR